MDSCDRGEFLAMGFDDEDLLAMQDVVVGDADVAALASDGSDLKGNLDGFDFGAVVVGDQTMEKLFDIRDAVALVMDEMFDVGGDGMDAPAMDDADFRDADRGTLDGML